jgi:hypothetical protein
MDSPFMGDVLLLFGVVATRGARAIECKPADTFAGFRIGGYVSIGSWFNVNKSSSPRRLSEVAIGPIAVISCLVEQREGPYQVNFGRVEKILPACSHQDSADLTKLRKLQPKGSVLSVKFRAVFLTLVLCMASGSALALQQSLVSAETPSDNLTEIQQPSPLRKSKLWSMDLVLASCGKIPRQRLTFRCLRRSTFTSSLARTQ